ncbi:hypothetical protein TNCV_4995501 [Trichonephila clavipes]|nr:hypothetical protein TNCV_4995501 [Trichonephila clavipes]
MKEGLIALNYECSKCNERMGLYERKSAVLDGDFECVCSTITSQNIYGRTPMILLIRPSRLFVKIRCHAVASTRKRSAVRNLHVPNILPVFCVMKLMPSHGDEFSEIDEDEFCKNEAILFGNDYDLLGNGFVCTDIDDEEENIVNISHGREKE